LKSQFPYSLSQIGLVLNQTKSFNHPDRKVEHLLFDSRELYFPESTLFFALSGTIQNGAKFIPDLYKSGVRAFVISAQSFSEIESKLSGYYYKEYSDADFIIVEDVKAALQSLAAFHRNQFQLPVLAITGSHAKTIIKEWIYHLANPFIKIVRSPKSFNSQIGVPISLWQIREMHELAIIEVGISKMNEMENLETITSPSLGIMTNIGPPHDEGFLNRTVKIQEKIALFRSCETIIFCGDHPSIQSAIVKSYSNKNLISWGREHTNKFVVAISKLETNKTLVEITENEGLSQNRKWGVVQLPFEDDPSIENACHAIISCIILGLNFEQISPRCATFERLSMRMETKKGINQCILVNDSYTLDLNALSLGLSFLEKQSPFQNKTVILSDFLETGISNDILYQKLAHLLVTKKVNRLIGIGPAIASLKEKLPSSITAQYYSDTDQFISSVKSSDFQREGILIKGARKFKFERIMTRLEEKTHKTRLEIDLDAITHNLQVYHNFLPSETRIMAMVKAGGYGSGSYEIAKALEQKGVHYFGVAYADEGIDLREMNIRTPIMVLNPEEGSLDAMSRFNLEPEIYNFSLLNACTLFSEKGNHFPGIHIKFDTGMHRLGFQKEDINELCLFLQEHSFLRVKTIFTHLASSENSDHDDFSRLQIQRFTEMYDRIVQTLGYKPWRHVLNSGGITRFIDSSFEMVRLGIGLYGVDSNPEIQKQLKTALALKASISQIKWVQPPETIGYGRKGVITKPTKIAIVSIGYADGFLRRASLGNFSLAIHGKLAPTVGAVCMDMCMVDISDIPEALEGDDVIVFGHFPKVETLAKSLETIPYEVFTSISSRVARVYHRE
jgi:Alr-MurF fusion protein